MSLVAPDAQILLIRAQYSGRPQAASVITREVALLLSIQPSPDVDSLWQTISGNSTDVDTLNPD